MARKKPYGLIHKKEAILQHLQELNVFEKEELFQKLKDTFYVYGFSPEEVKNFLNYNGDYFEEYTDRQLTDLEGVANALLFELKYKRRK